MSAWLSFKAPASGVWAILVTWKVFESFDFSGTPDSFQSAQIKPRQIVVQGDTRMTMTISPHVADVSTLHMHHLFFHLSSDGSLVESKLFAWAAFSLDLPTGRRGTWASLGVCYTWSSSISIQAGFSARASSPSRENSHCRRGDSNGTPDPR